MSETKDGVTKTAKVEKVENGYVVTINKFGTDKKGEWRDITKKWISSTNPLENSSEDVKEKPFSSLEQVYKAIDSL